MSLVFTHILECSGECGAKIEITTREDKPKGLAVSAAETLGWMTRDTKDKKKRLITLFFCNFCQARADLIVNGS